MHQKRVGEKNVGNVGRLMNVESFNLLTLLNICRLPGKTIIEIAELIYRNHRIFVSDNDTSHNQ